jgi:hypothetical protein
MALSVRAQNFLATLERRPAVSIERVREALARAECPPIDSWIDFHERYAGYVDPLGREEAVLGLVHEESRWHRENEVFVDNEEGPWTICCAEVHPSFDYTLHEDGAFHSFGGGGPCASYDVKVEQDSLIWDARRDGRPWRLAWNTKVLPAGGLDRLRERVRAVTVPEASDRFATAWRGTDALWVEWGERVVFIVATDEWPDLAALIGMDR